MRRPAIPSILLPLAVLGVATIALFPVILMARIAFIQPVDYREMPIDWFAPIYTGSMEVVLGRESLRHLLNSLIISSLVTLMVTAISAPAAHALAKIRARRKENFLFFVLSTRMGPAVVFALPIFLLMTRVKLVDTYPGMILVYIFYNLAFAIWMLHGFFSDIPSEIEEAGLVDGLTEFGVFRKISLPMAVPGLIATMTLVFILTWNEFFYAFVLTRDVARTFPTDVPAFFGAFRVEWGQMFAASVLGIFPPVLFGLAVRRWLTRGLSGGTIDIE